MADRTPTSFEARQNCINTLLEIDKSPVRSTSSNVSMRSNSSLPIPLPDTKSRKMALHHLAATGMEPRHFALVPAHRDTLKGTAEAVETARAAGRGTSSCAARIN
ncbi:hypothetical protein JR316_0009211 [Psilocybe cubensis]|uniref:Uncharacterized protein n=1 Tax=Psilocybe cubensis TaxID=181762 RepID=A0ACB8GU50_PSICU|nr:hypothetical protein JR316_0009211 [Psilocybe cubensis]KAH9478751.1 hypothetical protein JR316_0009211 [Psilocybe cubensis]